jgi:hypothetical protein
MGIFVIIWTGIYRRTICCTVVAGSRSTHEDKERHESNGAPSDCCKSAKPPSPQKKGGPRNETVNGTKVQNPGEGACTVHRDDVRLGEVDLDTLAVRFDRITCNYCSNKYKSLSTVIIESLPA